MSDSIMRTGTGVRIPSQESPVPPRPFVEALRGLGFDFYLHHVIPGETGTAGMLTDLAAADMEVVLGNEFGNINGPHAPRTNRYDIPGDVLNGVAASGLLAGVLYDEPEHLQINAAQYRTDDFLPHFGMTDGFSPDDAEMAIAAAARRIVDEIAQSTSPRRVPVVAEHVFPVLFHTLARGGFTPCPKVMKEAFQPLQLSTALGASLQYGREFWICADLWGPDVGPWFTRAPGFPGHSPEEFASALRLAYHFAPDRLFIENVDALVRGEREGQLALTEHGAAWEEFIRKFVPEHPLRWSHRDARPDVVLIHAEDSDFGRGERPFGNRDATSSPAARSIFEAWHLLSDGRLPRHGSSMHAPGFDFPRRRLDDRDRATFPLAWGAEVASGTHGLFFPSPNVVVFDEKVRTDQLLDPKLILVVGSRLPSSTAHMLRARAERGVVVAIASWLVPPELSRSRRFGNGAWVVFDDFDDDSLRSAITPNLPAPGVWKQRFGDSEIQIRAQDDLGMTLEFDVVEHAI